MSLLFLQESDNLGALKTSAGIFPTRHAPFLETRWSALRDLSSEKNTISPERTQELLAQLCEDYWPPLYRFLRCRGYSRYDAQDLTQGFFVYLLEKEAYKLTRPDKGQFRTFLLHLLRRYLNGAHLHQNRRKRGGDYVMVLIDDHHVDAVEKDVHEALLVDAPMDEQRAFDCDWAAALVKRAMTALQADYARGQKTRIFETLRPFLRGGVGLPTQEQAATRLGVPLETLRSHIFRLRARYRMLLRAEVARTVATEQEVESELRYSCRVLVTSF